MSLTTEQLGDVMADFMRQISAEREPIAIIKPDLRDLILAVDGGLSELAAVEKAALREHSGYAVFGEFERPARPDPPEVGVGDVDIGDTLKEAQDRRTAEIARYRTYRRAVDAIRSTIDLDAIRAADATGREVSDRQLERIAVLCQTKRAEVS